MSKVYDIVGKKFGRLVVIERIGNDRNGCSRWLCKCDCGNNYRVLGRSLASGATKSCGCFHRECVGNRSRNTSPLRPYEALYKEIKRHTKYEVDLTYEEFLSFVKEDRCHYCRSGIFWRQYNVTLSHAYNLDRKNNANGYSRENCVVCCGRCNKSKGAAFTYEQWYKMTEPWRLGDLTRG